MTLIECSLALKQAGILHRDRDVLGEPAQQLQLLMAESIELGMHRVENADHAITDSQRNGHRRHGVLFAGKVIGIAAHIGRVMHFSRQRHMAHHALFADS